MECDPVVAGDSEFLHNSALFLPSAFPSERCRGLDREQGCLLLLLPLLASCFKFYCSMQMRLGIACLPRTLILT